MGALYGIARYLAYAGFVLLVGGAAFVAGLPSGRGPAYGPCSGWSSRAGRC